MHHTDQLPGQKADAALSGPAKTVASPTISPQEREKLLEGLRTPLAECLPEEQVPW